MSRDPLEALRLPVLPVHPRPEFAAALLSRVQGAPAPTAVPGPPEAGRHSATVRYFVDDMDQAVSFYCRSLGFEEELRPAPAFAMLYRGDLRLLLSLPTEPHALPDGTRPSPGGFNRMSLRVADLASTVDRLRGQGATLVTPITAGPTVNTVLVRDPAGNLVELFEPRGEGYHERPSTPSTEERP
ncbi:MAG TPA: VOC family protein [Solirubrobacteraceae bacterium]|jgi:catechol 2,3-dioxygenase-like lactoylglutathione lyase family enzyme